MNPTFEQRRYLIPFRVALLPQIFTDVLVIGSGVAGMRAALAAAEHGEVIVTAKGSLEECNTFWAQGGIAAVLPPELAGEDHADTFEAHFRDTMDAGGGLCDPRTVHRVVEGGPDTVRDLLELDMALDRGGDPQQGSRLSLGREGGHSLSRILHTDGDATGKAMARALHAGIRANEKIRMFDHCFVLDLLTLEGASTPQCVGAITHHPKYGLQVIWAAATILASGGCGQVYRESTNPAVATGDGLAMAYRAGASLADLAFIQFHPTTLYIAGASRSLITEAVRGEGGVLIDHNGYRFMTDYHAQGDLAPRDVVTRAILTQMQRTSRSHVFLDCRHIGTERFAKRFPGIFRLLRNFEIDPGKEPIPIHPSAHYMIGGVYTDLDGRTTLKGLYAAGEAACTGLHGANRLASNSLLEGMVFGKAAGEACREMHDQAHPGPVRIVSDIPISDRSELDLGDVRSSLRSVMWRHVGIERSGARLEEVAEMFAFWGRYTMDKIFDDREGWEVQNMLMLGAVMTRAAHWRNESRGTHYRLDFPEPDEHYRCHDLWQRDSGEPERIEIPREDAAVPG